MDRRKFLKSTCGAIGTTGISSMGYSRWVEPHWLKIEKHILPIPELPNHLIGKTIAQISDTHIGDLVDDLFLIKSFKVIQDMNPDFVMYTGDYVNLGNESELNQMKRVMRKAPKGRLGTLAVLGNHDYGESYTQSDVAHQVTSILQNNGIQTLRNKFVNLNGLKVVGIDDYWGTNFNPRPMMTKYGMNAHIALCHNPDVCDLDIWNQFKGTILSGHTHGGQCKPPFLPPPLLPVKNKKYTSGFFDLEGGRKLYINRGLGHSLKIRFMVRPEITLFSLKKL